jgi:tetratricopeptide (TPR) repeat protein
MKQGIVEIVVLVGLLICMVIQPVMAETAEELFVKGQDLADQGKYSQAIQYYDQALAITQTNDQIYYFKGNALLYLKKYQEAIDTYNAALAINPQNKAAQHNLNTAKTQMAQTVTPTSTSTPSASWQQKYQDAQDQKKVHDALSPVSPLVVFGALGLLVLFRRVRKA